MKIIRADKDFRATGQGLAATVGFFDGVHAGHRYLLEQLIETARSEGLTPAVVTFPRHPQLALSATYVPTLLTSADEKLRLIADLGVETCYLIDFTPEFAALDAERFICNVLRERLNIRHLLVGYDHRFGRNREDGIEQYREYGAKCGLTVSRAAELPGEHVSSTIIRRLLMVGCVEEAATMLTRPYTLTGTVVHGNHLGRTIGFPTANLALTDARKLVPGQGIYAARVSLGDEQFRGMAYIGTRPTVDQKGEQRVETHILDFDREIYGETLTVEFLHFVREDRTFSSLDGLKEQLKKDKEEIEQYYKS